MKGRRTTQRITPPTNRSCCFQISAHWIWATTKSARSPVPSTRWATCPFSTSAATRVHISFLAIFFFLLNLFDELVVFKEQRPMEVRMDISFLHDWIVFILFTNHKHWFKRLVNRLTMMGRLELIDKVHSISIHHKVICNQMGPTAS